MRCLEECAKGIDFCGNYLFRVGRRSSLSGTSLSTVFGGDALSADRTTEEGEGEECDDGYERYH